MRTFTSCFSLPIGAVSTALQTEDHQPWPLWAPLLQTFSLSLQGLTACQVLCHGHSTQGCSCPGRQHRYDPHYRLEALPKASQYKAVRPSQLCVASILHSEVPPTPWS